MGKGNLGVKAESYKLWLVNSFESGHMGFGEGQPIAIQVGRSSSGKSRRRAPVAHYKSLDNIRGSGKIGCSGWT